MKTPDEIKKALECCFYDSEQCGECPYYPVSCDRELVRDAREYIRQLEAQNDAVKKAFDEVVELNNRQAAIVKQLQAERDALMVYVKGQCCACKFSDYSYTEDPCDSCFADRRSRWQWRGVQKEE